MYRRSFTSRAFGIMQSVSLFKGMYLHNKGKKLYSFFMHSCPFEGKQIPWMNGILLVACPLHVLRSPMSCCCDSKDGRNSWIINSALWLLNNLIECGPLSSVFPCSMGPASLLENLYSLMRQWYYFVCYYWTCFFLFCFLRELIMVDWVSAGSHMLLLW